MSRMFLSIFLPLALASLFSPVQPAAADNNAAAPQTPQLRVRGYGLRGNRELRRTIKLLDTEEERRYYDAAFIEDAAFIMLSVLKQDGYLYPAVRVEFELADGTERSFLWREGAEVILPRPVEALSVRFTVEPGVLFYYKNVDISGIRALDENQAMAYFIPADFLLPLKSTRVFTPAKLNAGIDNLREILVSEGYHDALAIAREVDIDRETGAVSVSIDVAEGELYLVEKLEKEIHYTDTGEWHRETRDDIDAVYTRRWVQDRVIILRNRFLRKGYADVAIDVDTTKTPVEGEAVAVDLLFRVQTGRKVYLDEIVLMGIEKTRRSMLKRRIGSREGEELNRLELEDARYRLARLGIFESVELEYEEVEPGRRRAVFRLREGDRTEASLMVGYGSYEMLRGGIEVAQYNIFGRAHRSRLGAIQSFKSTSVDYTYTVPEVLRRDIDAFATVSALRRREIDFLREEYGGSVGIHTYSDAIDSDLSFRYGYRALESRRFDDVEQYGMRRANAGSVTFDMTHDRRDNPISPRTGYKLGGSLEVASRILLGEAAYQRLELASSLHGETGRGFFVSLGLKHALVDTPGRVQNHLPFSKRFFPGGEHSVRGYQHGGASPRDDEGKLIGAETYTLLNFEVEQMITPSWSVVLFFDGLAAAQKLGSYPCSETLYSVGGGVRYSTFMGPLRVEYGHNPSPRSGDPSGTLHVSLGFPF